MDVLNTYFQDEMEFVGLTIDEYNLMDIRVYYDILANRGDVKIQTNPDLATMSMELGIPYNTYVTTAGAIGHALQIKLVFDDIISRGVIEGEEIVEGLGLPIIHEQE